LEAELRSQFLLRDDDVALVGYQSRKYIKRALSLLSGQPQALCWLMLSQSCRANQRAAKIAGHRDHRGLSPQYLAEPIKGLQKLPAIAIIEDRVLVRTRLLNMLKRELT